MKKAVLVGVGDYRDLANRLTAPPHEVFFWKSLLMSDVYGFDDVLPLVDQEATPDAVLDALTALLQNAKADDQLVFGFFGHGCLTRCLGPGGPKDVPDKAILVYPTNDYDLRSAAIGFVALNERIAKADLPPGVDFTIILDCCFAGADSKSSVDFAPAKILFVPNVDSDLKWTDGSRHAFDGGPSLKVPAENALIVAGASEWGAGYQVTVNGIDRLLFSMRALEELRTAASSISRPTFDQLIAAITPLSPHYDQTPSLLGDLTRRNERFPGEPGAAVALHKQFASRLSDEVSAAAKSESTIAVRFDGICCFVDARNENDAFVKRVVLPYDEPITEMHRHIAFLEVAADDIDGTYTGKRPAEQYVHEDQPVRPGDVQYYRWDLSGHQVTITGALGNPPATVTPAYVRHIPQMRKIQPELKVAPRNECFEANPDPGIIAAYFDIVAGRIDVGAVESGYTSYTPPKEWPRGRGSKFVTVTVPVASEGITVRLTSFHGGDDQSTVIPLKPGTASLRIGNEQHADITGPGSGENPSTHFLLYYKLSDPASLPGELPIPDTKTVPINACTSTNWP